MERTINITCAIATLGWTVAVLLMLGGTIAAAESDMPLALVLMGHSLLAMGAAACLTVRTFFIRHARLMADAILLGHEARRLRATDA